MSFTLTVTESKAAFLDRAAIEAHLGKINTAILFKQGAIVRREMMQGLRYRKKPSMPGERPSVHRSDHFTRTTTNKRTGVSKTRPTSPLKELIFFAVSRRNTVVIGPALFKSGSGGGGVVPRTLEHGGQVVKRERVPKLQGRPATARQSESFRRLVKDGRIVVQRPDVKLTRAVVLPRPFARPAGEKAAQSSKFKDALRGR